MTQTSAAFRRDTQSLDGSISLSEIISALSYALDLTEGAVHGHALRSCLLGMRIAEEAKLPSGQTSSLYFALLLKDIGCNRNVGRMSKMHGAEDRPAKAGLESEDWTRAHKPSLSTLKLLWSNALPETGCLVRAARFVRNGVTHHQNISALSRLRDDRGPGSTRTCSRAMATRGLWSARLCPYDAAGGSWFNHGCVRIPDNLVGVYDQLSRPGAPMMMPPSIQVAAPPQPEPFAAKARPLDMVSEYVAIVAKKTG